MVLFINLDIDCSKCLTVIIFQNIWRIFLHSLQIFNNVLAFLGTNLGGFLPKYSKIALVPINIISHQMDVGFSLLVIKIKLSNHMNMMKTCKWQIFMTC